MSVTPRTTTKNTVQRFSEICNIKNKMNSEKSSHSQRNASEFFFKNGIRSVTIISLIRHGLN